MGFPLLRGPPGTWGGGTGAEGDEITTHGISKHSLSDVRRDKLKFDMAPSRFEIGIWWCCVGVDAGRTMANTRTFAAYTNRGGDTQQLCGEGGRYAFMISLSA